MKKFFVVLLAVLLCFPMTACFGGWEDTEIISAKVTYDSSYGKYYLEIVYDDGTVQKIETEGLENVKGDTGDKGDTGNGIAEIITEKKENETIITVKFTDTSIEDVLFAVPDGSSVTDVKIYEEDETHTSPYLVFTFSGGAKSQEVLLPRGKDGTGITDITYTEETDSETGAVTGGKLNIKLSDGSEKTFDISAATGIKSIEKVFDPTGEQYILQVTYTDGRTETFEFDRPTDPATWYSYDRMPSSSEGKDGDYWFNIDPAEKAIYVKVDGVWVEVVRFEDKDTTYSVVFDANGGKVRTQGTQEASRVTYRVKHGRYLSSANGNPSVPIPVRDGYKFLGWYTKKVFALGEEYTLTAFTDLTPVCSNLTLYARWEEIA